MSFHCTWFNEGCGFGYWAIAHWEAIVCWSFRSKSLQWLSFTQLPMTNDQLPEQPLLTKVYIAVDFQSQGHFFCGTFIVYEHYFPKLLLRIVVFVMDQYRWNPQLTPGLIYKQPATRVGVTHHCLQAHQNIPDIRFAILIGSVYNWPRIHYLSFAWQEIGHRKPLGGTPGNSCWGCATRFSKSWPYFRPKNVIFHTLFQTRPLKSIPVFRRGL